MMAKIIQFPAVDESMSIFGDKIQSDSNPSFKDACLRAEKEFQKAPSMEFHVAPGFEATAVKFNEENRAYILTLLRRIVEIEVELCLVKNRSDAITGSPHPTAGKVTGGSSLSDDCSQLK